MSFKYKSYGGMFPTEVRDGSLIIYVGHSNVSIPFKFLVEDFPYDNTEFPMCNVMCYLRNDSCIVVMRFDGTVTKFNSDMEVTGFMHFNPDVLYDAIECLSAGSVVGVLHNKKQSTTCNIYHVKDSKTLLLECVGDPELIEFSPDNNPLLMQDIMDSTRYIPRLKKLESGLYAENSGKYTVMGQAIRTTGFINM